LERNAREYSDTEKCIIKKGEKKVSRTEEKEEKDDAVGKHRLGVM
jgi:hypothetical protein